MFNTEVRGGPWEVHGRGSAAVALTRGGGGGGEVNLPPSIGGRIQELTQLMYGVSYAQYPEGTADLMAYATAADPCLNGLRGQWVSG